MKTNRTKAEQRLIAELCHQINSPLAAVRSALYLSAAHSTDAGVLRYLRLATAEIDAIAGILRQARIILGDVPSPESKPSPTEAGQHRSRRAAA